MPDQRNEPFERPPREEIPAISRAHVAAQESSDDDVLWVAAGMHHVILVTTGRRSGREHKVTLPYWLDANGDRIVVASFAGAPQHPAWYLNLADPDANPEILCKVQGRQFWSRPETLEGVDYETTWAALTADRPYYNDYQSETPRRIPLVRLRETRPA
ncbi:MAG TPA: nitroreductase/quinone reductase family protein [Acidimicrobiia bacterium]|nr:nitroreductase/quinone reductase family protein [Acidimicrobiia bacterium]